LGSFYRFKNFFAKEGKDTVSSGKRKKKPDFLEEKKLPAGVEPTPALLFDKN